MTDAAEPRSHDDDPSPADPFGFQEGDAWLEVLRDAERDPPSASLGPYVDLTEVVRGGQGVVFRARHGESGATVALKRLIAGSFATKAMRRRFRREVEIVARLNHPNIVALHGVERVDGQSILVMEWIDGDHFNRWASGDGARRPSRDVLSAVRTICDAVQYAHRHGVIHRDLKPSNILVDGDGRPRVLDFGLAKPIDAGDSSATRTSEFVGTPYYASPEQTGGGESIDIRADVYSIGVVLYEALTGELPYPKTADVRQFLRALESAHPTPPSARCRELDREVDILVLKAIAFDRDQRYPTVDALREDIDRYLDGRPILAHPPSVVYQLRKLVARNRSTVAFSAAIAVLLVLLAFTAERLGTRLRRQTDATALAREDADRQRTVAEKLLRILHEDIVSVTSPTRGGRRLRVDEAFDAFRARAADVFADDPATEAAIRGMLGRIDLEFGRFRSAAEQLAIAADRLGVVLGEDHIEVSRMLADLARAERRQSAFTAAERHFRLALHRLSNHEEAAAEAIRVEADLVDLLTFLCRFDEAEELATHLLSRPLDHTTHSRAMMACGQLDMQRGRLPLAERRFRRVIAAGRDDLDVAAARHALGEMLRLAGRVHEAEAELLQVLAVRRDLLGDHPAVADTLESLAWASYAAGQTERSQHYLRECEAVLTRAGGDDGDDWSDEPARSAMLLRQLGDLDGSRRALEVAVARARDTFEPPHHALVVLLSNLGETLLRMRRVEEAEPLILESFEMAEQLYPGDHPERAYCHNAVGVLRRAQGRHQEAASCYETALAMIRRMFPLDGPLNGDGGRSRRGHPVEVVVLNNLALVNRALGRPSADLLFESLALADHALPGLNADRADALAALGLDYLERSDGYARAEACLREAHRIGAFVFGDRSFERALIDARLGHCLRLRGKLDEARGLLHAAWCSISGLLGEDHERSLRSQVNLAQCLSDLGDDAGAEALFADLLQRIPDADIVDPGFYPSVQAATAEHLMRRQRQREAEPLMHAALTGMRRVYGDDAALTVAVKYWLGRCLVDLDRPREALPLLRGAADGLSTNPDVTPGVREELRAYLRAAERVEGPR